MKKYIMSMMIPVFCIVCCLGILIWGFPEMLDTVILPQYIVYLLVVACVYCFLYQRKKIKIIKVFWLLFILIGIFNISTLIKGMHIGYNLITDAYAFYSDYIFNQYEIANDFLLVRDQFTTFFLYMSIFFFLAVYTFWQTKHYFAVFMITFLPFFFVLLYSTPIARVFALPLFMLWFYMFISNKGRKGNRRATRKTACSVSVVCLLAVFLATPSNTYELRGTSGTLRERIAYRLEEMAYNITHADEEVGEVDLGKAGNRMYANVTHLYVYGENLTGSLYLKDYSGAIYEENSWQSLTEETYESLKDYDWSQIDSWIYSKNSDLKEILSLWDNEMIIRIDDRRPSKRYALIPYYMIYSSSELTNWYDAYRTGQEDEMIYRTYKLDDSSVYYTRVFEDEYIDFVVDNYLQVPDSARELFDDIMPYNQFSNLRTAEKIEFIKSYLRENTEYTLTPGRTPDDQDFVEYFLLENKKGYCVHYATAATLMLRYLDIPARYVTGYYLPSYEISYGVGNVQDNDAHAWVEIFDSEKGWTPIEFTPGYSVSRGTESSSPVVKNENRPETETPQTNNSSENHTTQNQNQSSTNVQTEENAFTLSMNMKIALGIVTALVIVILQRQIRIYRRKTKCLSSDYKQGITYSYFLLCKIMKENEIEESIYSICREAMYSQHEMHKEQSEEVYAYTVKKYKEYSKKLPIYKRLWLRYYHAI